MTEKQIFVAGYKAMHQEMSTTPWDDDFAEPAWRRYGGPYQTKVNLVLEEISPDQAVWLYNAVTHYYNLGKEAIREACGNWSEDEKPFKVGEEEVFDLLGSVAEATHPFMEEE